MNDYTVYRSGATLQFNDNKNRLGYLMTYSQMAQICTVTGSLFVPGRLLISVAIDKALIPHPYDEF